MLGLTHEEAIGYCKSTGRLLVSRDGIHVRFVTGPRKALVIQTPPHLRAASALCLEMVNYQQAERSFEGGLLWLGLWDGVSGIHRVGWRALEAMRRVHGVNASLEIAPATSFRADELVEEQAFLTYALAFGWGGYMIPSSVPYLLDLRTSDRFFVCAETARDLQDVGAALKAWKPVMVDESGGSANAGRGEPKRAGKRKTTIR
ncbi:MAG: hypothetical protein ACRD2F_07035 [Terriglobales bacterium]